MKNIVIIDVDGTISKVGNRLIYLQTEPKDWDAFYEACFEDEPIKEMCRLVQMLDATYEIYFCTGRRESVRKQTINWIWEKVYKKLENKDVIDSSLIMRPDGDFRHDIEIKPEQLKLAGIKLEDIAFILEDRNTMVEKWRELGVRCLQVADGDF